MSKSQDTKPSKKEAKAKSKKETPKVVEEELVVEPEVQAEPKEEPELVIELPDEEEPDTKTKKKVRPPKKELVLIDEGGITGYARKEVKEVKAASIPALPSLEAIKGNLDAWIEFSDQLAELVGEAEESDDESDDEDEDDEDEESLEDEDEPEDDERRRYGSESLEKRHGRSRQLLEWACYEFPDGEQPEAKDVLCCLGDGCEYAKDPSLIPRAEKGKRGKKSVGGYKESRKLRGTDVYVCDRCFAHARKDVDAAIAKARKAVEDGSEDGEVDVAEKKGKGKKGKDEYWDEVPLIVDPVVSAAIKREYEANGLPHAKAPKKKRRDEDSEDDESDEDESDEDEEEDEDEE